MSILSLISPEVIKIGLTGRDKKSVLGELLQILIDAGKITNSEEILAALLKRESLQSTGLEFGIAVPHAKTAAVNRLILAVGIDSDGIEFDAIDKRPSHLFFMLLSPPDRSGPHIGALAEIARLSQSGEVLEKLRNATTVDQVVSLLKVQ